MAYSLIVEAPDPKDLEYVLEEKNLKGEKSLYIQGPYMMAGEENRNKRVYSEKEMYSEVARYSDEFISTKRALGELNHPTTAEVDLGRACHMITELKMDGNVVFGKSKVLTNTPCGKIVEGLIQDGVQVGVSSRALGKLTPMEGKSDVNVVEEMKLIAIDCVADPSFPKAFVNGILESKQFICSENGSFEEVYENFEKGISTLPNKEVEAYLKEQVLSFLAILKQR
jgi:hypothetical protein|tara:strand:- start:67 stop:744 length:678 start_codon:yes stop_codon:yes gene_type:complete